MAYEASILADSVSPLGVRLTTFQVTFPRIVLAEFNTHRVFSRSSASSRAIPVEKRIAMVEADPFIPEAFGKNGRGMQATISLENQEAAAAELQWRRAAADAVEHARRMAELGVHKQLANRILEPFCWHTVVVTATEWDNFWALRCSPMAQPEIQKPAEMMRVLYALSVPVTLAYGEWHLPFVKANEPSFPVGVDARKVAIGRCARVSYLTHEGKWDPAADQALTDEKLLPSGHMAPLEHVATPAEHRVFVGNFRGWTQYRKTIPGEDVFSNAQ